MLGDFEYARARSVKQGCKLLAKAGGEGAVLAGGTDLLVNLRNGRASAKLLVDLKGVKSLDRLTVSPKNGAWIGASVPLNEISLHRGLRSRYPGLAEAAWTVGSYPIRNRATLVGNLCNASPAADTAPPLLVLDAVLEVSSPRGERTVPVTDLFVGVKRTSLAKDEVVTAVRVPTVPATTRTSFLKQQRVKGHDLAILNVAGLYDAESGSLRVAVGSCAVTPVLLPPLPEPVRPDAGIDNLARALDELAQRTVSPISDVRASAEYRRALLPVLLRRLVEALLQQKAVRR